MKYLYTGLTLYFTLFSFSSWSQDTYVPLQSEELYLFQRAEALSQHLNTSDLGGYLPMGRNSLANYLNNSKKGSIQEQVVNYSRTDQYNIDRAIGINGEWIEDASGMDAATKSKRPILNYFYTTKENLFHYNENDFFLVVNPILYAQVGKGLRNGNPNTYTNFRGAEIRGRIANRIGFYSMLGDNQEKPFSTVGNWEQKYHSFPGNDYYRRLDNGTFDAFVGRGYFTVDVIPGYTQLAFGYDKQFIGNGIRSMVQSNEGAASTFLRLKTNIGSFQIDNLYQELVSDFPGLGNDDRLPRKYHSFFQVSKNFGSKLNIALFENTMIGASNKYQLSNLLPALITHKVWGSTERDRKTSFGLQFKYLPLRSVQLYGQTMVDYINMGSNTNSYLPSNIFAAQLGIKYFNVLNINNLDLQAEVNMATKGMYQTNNTTSNHTHYNQPFAHSMGNNFFEYIGKLRYQPHHKFYIDVIGAVLFRESTTQDESIFYPIPQNTILPGSATSTTSYYGNANVAYELFTNFFLELGGTYIKGNTTSGGYAYGGLRWNIGRKQYFIYN